MHQGDGFNLQRFVAAQAAVFETALAELRAGRKQSHWMWFIFPQHRALGRSSRAQVYGIASLDEARAYLAHPLLGPRLDLATTAVLESDAASLHALFGSPDDLKFRSSMTLFEVASPQVGTLFSQALDGWCGGERDEQTLALVEPDD
jgi:uncharacterized protein (DUF1810 family)